MNMVLMVFIVVQIYMIVVCVYVIAFRHGNKTVFMPKN